MESKQERPYLREGKERECLEDDGHTWKCHRDALFCMLTKNYNVDK